MERETNPDESRHLFPIDHKRVYSDFFPCALDDPAASGDFVTLSGMLVWYGASVVRQQQDQCLEKYGKNRNLDTKTSILVSNSLCMLWAHVVESR